ncbi:hypothetical protein [Bradyrhizobium sp. STM 3557]|uniref:hypothetical protein n=1 Tax=Bradyrhizobium sp. STM 3557 TaxID=578920 RepID=UPI00388F425C
MTKTGGEDGATQTATRRLTGIPLLVAVLIVLLWLASLIWMGVVEIGDLEPRWQRLVFLFNSFESVAFAAAGALLGREINRQRADNAEARATKAEEQADLGKQVAQAVKSEAQQMKSTQHASFTLVAQSESLRLANKLLPN